MGERSPKAVQVSATELAHPVAVTPPLVGGLVSIVMVEVMGVVLAFTPSLPSSHLIYRIARADPGQPAEQLVRDTKEALFGAGLMTVSALGVALMRRMRRLQATSKIMSLPVSTSEKVE